MREQVEIRIKYFTEGLEPVRMAEGSDWIDLRTAEEVRMRTGEYRLIRLGVGMELPEGWEAHVVPRSSTFQNYGLLQANAMGVVDGSYRGDHDEWRWPAYATRDIVIPKNTRICQFRIIENQPRIEFKEVKHLKGPDRGGFGSTGRQ